MSQDIGQMISQALGYAILAGSFSLKLPQIIKSLKAGSVDGVSEATTLMETFVFLTSFLYGLAKGMPLETFGENGICAVQCVFIYFMILYYQKQLFNPIKIIMLIGLAVYTKAFLDGHFNTTIPQLPGDRVIYEWLYLSLTPIGVISRIPQILIFYRNKSTGNAAFLTWFLNFGGSSARVFTTFMQVNDPAMLFNFVLNAFLGGIIVLQFFLYWNSDKDKEADKKKKQ
eukprot:TRINITY_DN6303_c0_g1_i1.p2 TRINITY_DN6303_c0_g1~~TRINITY_DN6303_c0_g1_i1.p2  ORF type:complete len:228 (+),score=100.21 TRINITY_DN6303_c0_g1_i1:153-836(+)